MRRRYPSVMESTARFKAESVRDTLRKRGLLLQNLVRYCYRPFDVRWLHWDSATNLLDRPRPEYLPHVCDGNLWIEGRQRIPQEAFDRGLVTSVMADNLGNGLSNYFPLFLRERGNAAPNRLGLEPGTAPEEVDSMRVAAPER